MAKPEIKTELRTVFEAKVDTFLAQFRINEKNGSDAEVSFNGGTWMPADVVYHAIKAFEQRFPEAFDEE